MSAKTLIDGIVKSLNWSPKGKSRRSRKVYSDDSCSTEERTHWLLAYTTKGGETVGSRTTGGFGAQEAQQFLIDKISQGDEAKATRALDAYSTVVEMFGGLALMAVTTYANKRRTTPSYRSCCVIRASLETKKSSRGVALDISTDPKETAARRAEFAAKYKNLVTKK
jgi:hypothetical protein